MYDHLAYIFYVIIYSIYVCWYSRENLLSRKVIALFSFMRSRVLLSLIKETFNVRLAASSDILLILLESFTM